MPISLCDSKLYGRIYNVTMSIIENSQGVFVSLLFCFMNNEVKQLLKSSINSHFKSISRIDLTMSTNRNEISLQTTETSPEPRSKSKIQDESPLLKKNDTP